MERGGAGTVSAELAELERRAAEPFSVSHRARIAVERLRTRITLASASPSVGGSAKQPRTRKRPCPT
jgi:hypothetical protein